jgi:uncharacterized protein YegL
MSHLRRLPVYLVIDCSESMAGAAFEAVKSGLHTLLNELLRNPQALESAWLSVITFGRRAVATVPMTDITQFQLPKLVLGSGTAMGEALELLENQMKAEVVAQTEQRKGDWKPICFILTDGEPTDRWEKAAERFRSQIAVKKANVIAVACGPDVNISTLKRITETVLQLNDGSAESFGSFFKWVSASVQTTSVKYSSGRAEGVELPGLPAAVEIAQEGISIENDRFVFLQSKCNDTKRFYLVRFKSETTKAGFFGGERTIFKFKAAHALDDFDMETGGKGQQLSVGSDLLDSEAPCPYCSNRGWGMCSCGRVLCMNPRGGRYTCPWCGTTGDYAPTSFDVGRGAG